MHLLEQLAGALLEQVGHGAGIGSGVLGVQFVAHGPRLGNQTVSSGKEFGLVVGDADKPAPAASTGSEPSLI